MKTQNDTRNRLGSAMLASLILTLTLAMHGASLAQEPLFLAEVSYYVGDGPCDIAVGDFDEDGHSDVAVSLQYPVMGNIVVLLGNGDGTLQYADSYTAGNQPRCFATEDFDGDGHVDLAVTNAGSGDVSVLLGNGDGSFGTAMNFAVASMPLEGVVAEDFDGDGHPDLAVSCYWSSNVSILIGVGDGTFEPAVHYSAGWYPRDLAAGDFNEDGNIDLAVGNTMGLGPYLLAGNGDGTFQTAVGSSLTGAPWSVSTADLNQDGHMDLASVRQSMSLLSVSLGLGDGTFSAPVDYAVGGGPQYIGIWDFDNDGKPDIAVSNESDGTLSLLLGNGDGTFQYALDDPAAVGYGPFGLAAADLDEDGYPDLAVAEHIDDSLTILLSNREPVIGSLAVTYDGDELASTGGEQTADVNLIATLRDDEGYALDIDGEEVTFTLTADGAGTVVASALTGGGVAHAVEALEPGVYTVEVALASFDASASAELVVYNPRGGFVTGRGWMHLEDDGLNVNPGARVNFRLNAYYRGGDPTGYTGFRYRDGYIDLRSTSIEMLVITSGGVAQLSGWARVNREDGWWFSAKVADNGRPGRGRDMFEINVWAPDAMVEDEPIVTAGGTLKGGNIVVHKRRAAVPGWSSSKNWKRKGR